MPHSKKLKSLTQIPWRNIPQQAIIKWVEVSRDISKTSMSKPHMLLPPQPTRLSLTQSLTQSHPLTQPLTAAISVITHQAHTPATQQHTALPTSHIQQAAMRPPHTNTPNQSSQFLPPSTLTSTRRMRKLMLSSTST